MPSHSHTLPKIVRGGKEGHLQWFSPAYCARAHRSPHIGAFNTSRPLDDGSRPPRTASARRVCAPRTPLPAHPAAKKTAQAFGTLVQFLLMCRDGARECVAPHADTPPPPPAALCCARCSRARALLAREDCAHTARAHHHHHERERVCDERDMMCVCVREDDWRAGALSFFLAPPPHLVVGCALPTFDYLLSFTTAKKTTSTARLFFLVFVNLLSLSPSSSPKNNHPLPPSAAALRAQCVRHTLWPPALCGRQNIPHIVPTKFPL